MAGVDWSALVSKNKQRVLSNFQLGYADAKSGLWGPTGRYTVRGWRMRWSYRHGYAKAIREMKYGKKARKPFVTSQGAVAVLSFIGGFTAILVVAIIAS